MCNARQSIPEAEKTPDHLVSSQSIVEGGYLDVMLKTTNTKA